MDLWVFPGGWKSPLLCRCPTSPQQPWLRAWSPSAPATLRTSIQTPRSPPNKISQSFPVRNLSVSKMLCFKKEHTVIIYKKKRYHFLNWRCIRVASACTVPSACRVFTIRSNSKYPFSPDCEIKYFIFAYAFVMRSIY